MNWLTEAQQKTAIEKIKSKGMTVTGWARTRGFSPETVKNILYRESGTGNAGPVAEEIITALKKEKLL